MSLANSTKVKLAAASVFAELAQVHATLAVMPPADVLKMRSGGDIDYAGRVLREHAKHKTDAVTFAEKARAYVADALNDNLAAQTIERLEG